MSQLVYIIGYPGSGKTTATKLALGDDIVEIRDKPFKHTLYQGGAVELGYRRLLHGGTDALSFNVQPKVVTWLATASAHCIVGEGDRLSNNSFFNAVQQQGLRLQIIHIKVGELIALKRMIERGSLFDPAWIKGRMSKVDNLAAQWRDQITTIDGKLKAEAIAEILAEKIFFTKKEACAHHWVYEAVTGPTSIGICKKCGAKMVGANHIPDPKVRDFTV